MSNKWIYDRVNHLITKYNTRNPEKLIKDLNIQLFYINKPSSLLGMYKVILKTRFIFIANNVGSLKNTILAHEIAHDQLHRKKCIKGASFHESRVFNYTNRYELEANIFAAHLLIPDEDVLSMIKYSQSDRELAGELGVDINLLNLKISEMAKLNMLNIREENINLPDSTFLRHYRPLNDDWHDI